jgi:hypothetical protein
MPILYILDFGAVGDGKSNDAAAIDDCCGLEAPRCWFKAVFSALSAFSVYSF